VGSLLVIAYLVGVWNLVLVILGLLSRSSRGYEAVGASWGTVLAIVPAHNEAAVIETTVTELLRSGCMVLVVADRCSDGTAALAVRAGAMVYTVDQGNKGRAINQFLDESDLAFGFDCLTIVDCGTVVEAEYGGRVKEALLSYRYVQGWLHSSGRLSWVNVWGTWNFALFHAGGLGRRVLRLPAWVGGTGFAWRSTERVRFDGRCLVEDLELSLRLHSSGVDVGYCDLGVIDEKVSTLKESIRQRMRWARGNWWLVMHGRFLTWRVDDVMSVLGEVTSLVFGMVFVLVGVRYPLQLALSSVIYVIVGAAAMVRFGEIERFRPSLIVSVPFMAMVQGAVSLAALLTWRRTNWNRTEHQEGRRPVALPEA
jgi:cellulose synthase/poly-beta-1,6-N-acetylglucosamine synthase-like glycosyltransferase